jgi:hypothetical protein
MFIRAMAASGQDGGERPRAGIGHRSASAAHGARIRRRCRNILGLHALPNLNKKIRWARFQEAIPVVPLRSGTASHLDRAFRPYRFGQAAACGQYDQRQDGSSSPSTERFRALLAGDHYRPSRGRCIAARLALNEAPVRRMHADLSSGRRPAHCRRGIVRSKRRREAIGCPFRFAPAPV